MEAGRIVDQAAPAVLSTRDGLYARMQQLQSEMLI